MSNPTDLHPALADASHHAVRAGLGVTTHPALAEALLIVLAEAGSTHWTVDPVRGRLVVSVPYLDELATEPAARSAMMATLASLNLGPALVSFGVDLNDGEIRATVVVPLPYGRLGEELFGLITEEIDSAVKDYVAARDALAAAMSSLADEAQSHDTAAELSFGGRLAPPAPHHAAELYAELHASSAAATLPLSDYPAGDDELTPFSAALRRS